MIISRERRNKRKKEKKKKKKEVYLMKVHGRRLEGKRGAAETGS